MNSSQETVYVRSRGASAPRASGDGEAAGAGAGAVGEAAGSAVDALAPDRAARLRAAFAAVPALPECRADAEARAAGYERARAAIAAALDAVEGNTTLVAAQALATHVAGARVAADDPLLPATLLLRGSPAVLAAAAAAHPEWDVVTLRAQECATLKTALKLVVRRVVPAARMADMEAAFGTDGRLIYDFEVLEQYLGMDGEARPGRRIVICLEDADAFDADLLRGLVEYTHAYVPALPLHLVLNLDVSTALLEDRLTADALFKLAALRVSVGGAAGEAAAGVAAGEASTDFSALLRKTLAPLGVHVGPRLLARWQTAPPAQAAKMAQYACLAYYTTNPLASLRPDTAEGLLGLIRRLPSAQPGDSMRASGAPVERELDDATLALRVHEALAAHARGEAPAFLREALLDNFELNETVFSPSYRPALETALAEPSLTEPAASRAALPLATLYQLCREASMFVNIYDLYQAFAAVIEPPAGAETARADDKQALAWFLEGVAELKLMGVVRDSKRKFECIEKVSWKDV